LKLNVLAEIYTQVLQKRDEAVYRQEYIM